MHHERRRRCPSRSPGLHPDLPSAPGGFATTHLGVGCPRFGSVGSSLSAVPTGVYRWLYSGAPVAAAVRRVGGYPAEHSRCARPEGAAPASPATFATRYGLEGDGRRVVVASNGGGTDRAWLKPAAQRRSPGGGSRSLPHRPARDRRISHSRGAMAGLPADVLRAQPPTRTAVATPSPVADGRHCKPRPGRLRRFECASDTGGSKHRALSGREPATRILTVHYDHCGRSGTSQPLPGRADREVHAAWCCVGLGPRRRGITLVRVRALVRPGNRPTG
jgi:hypothetical protein